MGWILSILSLAVLVLAIVILVEVKSNKEGAKDMEDNYKKNDRNNDGIINFIFVGSGKLEGFCRSIISSLLR